MSEADSLADLELDKGVVWVNTIAKSEKELNEIRKKFGFHKLSLENCIDPRQHPKTEIFDDHVLVV